MSTRQQIQIDFSAANSHAQLLDEIADQMKQLANQQMASTIQEMSMNWKGDSASAFFAKAEIVKSNIAETARSLHSIADNIRTNAKRAYDAEMAALNIAETRTSN